MTTATSGPVPTMNKDREDSARERIEDHIAIENLQEDFRAHCEADKITAATVSEIRTMMAQVRAGLVVFGVVVSIFAALGGARIVALGKAVVEAGK